MEQLKNKLYIPSSIADSLPSMVKNELARLSAQKQEEFVEEYKKNNIRKEKSVYFNAKQKLWVLTEKNNNKTKEFIKQYEETLPKKVKKKAGRFTDYDAPAMTKDNKMAS